GHGRHRPLSVGRRHMGIAIDAHVRSSSARGGSRGPHGSDETRFGKARNATRAARRRKRCGVERLVESYLWRTGERKTDHAARRREGRAADGQRIQGHRKAGQADGCPGKGDRPRAALAARPPRPPMHGATRKSLDTSKAKAMSGVTVVERDDLVAVLHADPERAGEALALIKAEWDRPAAAFDTESVGDYFVKNGGDGHVSTSKGDVTNPFAGDHAIESTFRNGYLAHAPMEPHTALAEWKDGKMTVWASTQSPFGARTRIAHVLGIEENKVRVITPFVGGGFGGKSSTEQGVEAARLAQITGKPVMMMWTRGEEFLLDTFGPAAVVRVNSAFNAAGKMTLWDYHVYAAGERSSEMLYDVPNIRMTSYLGSSLGGAK